MPGNGHVRFGGRAEETDRWKRRHRASVRPYASRLVGPALRADPAAVTPVLRTWARASDRWLRRTAVICQLGAKHGTDLALLTEAIEANLDDSDFFLRKGIGWALRQHVRTDAEWVRAFVATHPALSPLSRKEALRHL